MLKHYLDSSLARSTADGTGTMPSLLLLLVFLQLQCFSSAIAETMLFGGADITDMQ
jgi:hypothetical protein